MYLVALVLFGDVLKLIFRSVRGTCPGHVRDTSGTHPGHWVLWGGLKEGHITGTKDTY